MPKSGTAGVQSTRVAVKRKKEEFVAVKEKKEAEFSVSLPEAKKIEQ